MRIEKWTGLGGVSFLLCLTVGVALAPVPPVGTAAAREVASYFSVHADAVLRQVFMVAFLGGAALLVFVGGLSAVLRRAEGQSAGLSSVAFAGGVAMFPGLVVVAATHAGLARVAAEVSPEVTWAIWRVSTLADLLTTFLIGAFVASACVSAGSTGALPRWLVWLGLLCALTYLAMGLDVVLKDSAVSQTSPFGVVGLLLYVLWIGGTSVALLRGRSGTVVARQVQPAAIP